MSTFWWDTPPWSEDSESLLFVWGALGPLQELTEYTALQSVERRLVYSPVLGHQPDEFSFVLIDPEDRYTITYLQSVHRSLLDTHDPQALHPTLLPPPIHTFHHPNCCLLFPVGPQRCAVLNDGTQLCGHRHSAPSRVVIEDVTECLSHVPRLEAAPPPEIREEHTAVAAELQRSSSEPVSRSTRVAQAATGADQEVTVRNLLCLLRSLAICQQAEFAAIQRPQGPSSAAQDTQSSLETLLKHLQELAFVDSESVATLQIGRRPKQRDKAVQAAEAMYLSARQVFPDLPPLPLVCCGSTGCSKRVLPGVSSHPCDDTARCYKCRIQEIAPGAQVSAASVVEALVRNSRFPRAGKLLHERGASLYTGLLDVQETAQETEVQTLLAFIGPHSRTSHDRFAAYVCQWVQGNAKARESSLAAECGRCRKCAKPILRRVNTSWGHSHKNKGEYIRATCKACCGA